MAIDLESKAQGPKAPTIGASNNLNRLGDLSVCMDPYRRVLTKIAI